MTKPRKRPKPKPSQPPLKRLSDAQKRGDLARLVTQMEAQVQSAFADAASSVRDVIADFARAYAAERARIAEEQGEDDVNAVRVPPHWLVTSGWGAKLRHALLTAKHTANATARRAVQHGMDAAGALGEQDAKALLMVAMRPAIRAGATHWRPK